MGSKLKTILVSSLIAIVMIVIQNVQAISVFEATRGQNTPLAKYCTANPKSGPCISPSTADSPETIANTNKMKQLKQEMKAEQNNSLTANAQSDSIPQWKRDLVGFTLVLVANIPQGCDMLKQTDDDLLPEEHAWIIKIECIGFGGVNYIPEDCEQIGKAISQEHHSRIYSIKCKSDN